MDRNIHTDALIYLLADDLNELEECIRLCDGLFFTRKYYTCRIITVLIFGQVVVVESKCQESVRRGRGSVLICLV